MADIEAKVDKILELVSKQSVDITELRGELKLGKAETENLVNRAALEVKNYADATFVKNAAFTGMWCDMQKKNQDECKKNITWWQRTIEWLWKFAALIIAGLLSFVGITEYYK